MTLRISSFGVRGYVGESLTPSVVMNYAAAFATHLNGGKVLLGRDTRFSSPMIHAAVTASLLSCGCEVLDFGICPTPILQFCVQRYKAAGALAISGGHNGMGWNAISLIGANGAFLEPLGGEPVLEYFHAGDFLKKDYKATGTTQPIQDFIKPYFEELARHLNVETIRRANFTVLIDPVGGAGCNYLEPFANLLGFKLIPINAQESGYLAREAEPRPRSGLQMASYIKHVQGDVGFVLSSDMGRLSVVTEAAEPASEEYTFALIANHILSKKTGTLVTNCCTTRTVDEIAKRHNAPVVKTAVGQAYIMSAVADEQALLGGEGSGSVTLPAFSQAFDGFLMIGLILEAMAERKNKASVLLHELPRYHIAKRRILCGSREGYQALAALKTKYMNSGDGHIDLTDGLRVDWNDGWLHVRASRTEQLVRVISESSEKSHAEQRAEEAMRIIEQEI